MLHDRLVDRDEESYRCRAWVAWLGSWVEDHRGRGRREGGVIRIDWKTAGKARCGLALSLIGRLRRFGH